MKAFPGVVKPRQRDQPRSSSATSATRRTCSSCSGTSSPATTSTTRSDFYNQSDRWQVPTDPTQNTQDAQPPYYILAQRPGTTAASFQLTSALNAFNRDNLSAFISASSDPETYGADPGAATAGQHALPRAAAGAAVVHHATTRSDRT